jgi:beta-glucanase (GH16 family)
MTNSSSETYSGLTLPVTGPAGYTLNGTAPGQTLVGKAGVNSTLRSDGGASKLIGGGNGANNTFVVDSSADEVIAGIGDGTDTIISYASFYALPAGVENLQIGSSSGGIGMGNDLNNIITAKGSGAHTLIAGTGEDILTGTGSQDRFIITNGDKADVITNFANGSDVVQLNNFSVFTSFAVVRSQMTQVGADVVLNLGGNQMLTFTNRTISQFTPADFALSFAPTGLKMTFDDEFNSFSASANGSSGTWMTSYASGRTLASNHEAEYYSDSSVGYNPFSINNGVLDITARPGSNPLGLPYDSGVITTYKSFSQEYGYFEMRAELPAGQGLWPAFWLGDADGTWPPELDVMEMLGNDPGTIYSTTHSVFPGEGISTPSYVGDTSTGFHTYGVDWEPKTITFYFDGNAIASVPTPADMDKPMYMLANLAVGGAGSWPGATNSSTVFPATMQIDYIRAYATAATVAVNSTQAAPAQPNLNIVGWGETVTKGDGSWVVTGSGSGAHLTFGSGNSTITLTGSHNGVTLGDGNQTITLSGDSNGVTTGAGTSTINIGANYGDIVIGATPTGTTQIVANGFAETISSTGTGNVSITGPNSGSKITLMDGNDTISLNGSGNTVIVGVGTSTINAGIGQGIVHAGGGADTITVTGYNNLLDAGPGTNVLNGGSGNDTFVLNGAGQGLDTINNFHIGTDVLDLTRTLAGLGVAADLSNLGRFVTASVSGGNTTLLVDPTGGSGTPSAFAVLDGVSTSVSALLSHHAVIG